MTESRRRLDRSAGPDEADREDREREWLHGLVSDVWQTRLDFYRELIDKVADDRYPSPTMLDMIEQGVPPELYPDYVAALVGKVYDSKYPSPTLLARLRRLTAVPNPQH
ncbi:hypothetical protein ACFY2R_06370 [Micromonospora olivasterospora]|uniref:Uncharacterized protein n=1 Tax=Micromonospora olivasterospora TaxID=1880 RepID=A0A562IEE3_MICOL|nr:hypothetical protein [Micromonospora olivasterospora]TWH69073.1 hypothetical protein JD77_04075 [Micromonospora olivasterospora]